MLDGNLGDHHTRLATRSDLPSLYLLTDPSTIHLHFPNAMSSGYVLPTEAWMHAALVWNVGDDVFAWGIVPHMYLLPSNGLHTRTVSWTLLYWQSRVRMVRPVRDLPGVCVLKDYGDSV